MKKILIILYLAFTQFSCVEDFLDLPLEGKATANSDPNFVENLLTGVYNSLLLGEAFGAEGDIHGIAFVSATNIISDDAEKGSTPNDQVATVGQLDKFTISPTNVFVQSLWAGYYNGIAKCNQAIKELDLWQNPKKDQYLSEVKTIRAYYYFNLVRWFGDIPLITQVPKDAQAANTDLVYQTRASEEKVYQLIIDDLEHAKEFLQNKNQVLPGRINKQVAESILAKVYLYKKEYQKSAELCNSIIQSNLYGLLENYDELWREKGNNSIESIFEIQTGVFNNSDFGVNTYSMFQGPRVGGKGGWTDLGWGFCTPSQDLVNAYEPGDKRKMGTIIFIDNSGNHLGTRLFDGFRVPSSDSVENLRYNYKAYHSENPQIESWLGNRDLKQKNIHILRYAEILLIKAECENALGNSVEAINYINLIRSRAGLIPIEFTNKEDFTQKIWKERRLELAMEHDRFFDLVRTEQAVIVFKNLGLDFVSGKNEHLPIPALQIALSGGKLTQNHGY